jgi:Omp85 superfamily domain
LNYRSSLGLTFLVFLSASRAAAEPVPPAAAEPVSPAAVVPAPISPVPPHRWDYAFIPVVFYAPETSLGLGGGFVVFNDTPTPPNIPRRDDSIAFLVEGTLRKQVIVNLSGVKFWDAARYQLTEDGALVRFPSYFWGVGNDTPESAKDVFNQDLASSRTSFGVRLAEEIYAGAGLAAGWYNLTGYAPVGSVASYVAEHPARGNVLGAGPFLRRDTRDDAMGPHRGSFSSLTATFYREGVGSSYSYAQFELLHRAFLPIGRWSVLALEAYGSYAPGDVPLGDLPALGGSARLRGYFQGRFRDHVYLAGQAEWRIRLAGRFSVAPFVAVGNVFPSLSAVSFDRTKYAGGGAIRFSLKKERDLNIHIDVAKSPISSGVYLNLGEAF